MKLSPFGLYARTLRLELGMKLKMMADALGVSSAYLSSIEHDDRPLTEKIAEDTISFFSSKVNPERIDELRAAIDKSAQTVAVKDLPDEEKMLVAAFARRLSAGDNVPEEISNWLKKGGSDGDNG